MSRIKRRIIDFVNKHNWKWCDVNIIYDGEKIYVKDNFGSDLLIEISKDDNIIYILSDTDLCSVEAYHVNNNIVQYMFPKVEYIDNELMYIIHISNNNKDQYDDSIILSFTTT